MTQTRPRLDDAPELVAEVQAFADRYGGKLGIRLTFSDAVKILLRRALDAKASADPDAHAATRWEAEAEPF